MTLSSGDTIHFRCRGSGVVPDDVLGMSIIREEHGPLLGTEYTSWLIVVSICFFSYPHDHIVSFRIGYSIVLFDIIV